MKIALWWHLPAGGGKRALYDQVRYLAEMGHEIHAWCPATGDRDFLPLEGLASETVLPMPDLTVGSRTAPMLLHAAKVACEIEAGGFDLAFLHSCRWFAAPHLGRNLKLKSALYLHEPLRHLHESRPKPAWTVPAGACLRDRAIGYWRTLRNRKLASQEWTNAQGPTRILVNSLFSREAVVRAYGRNAKLCPLGVDVDYWTPGEEDRQPIIAGLGTVAPHKGIDIALRSIAMLPGPKPRLEWIGNFSVGRYAEEMRSYAKLLGVELNLRFAVPQDEVRDLLRKASVFFFPSRLEPMGYAPLEAGACGCPVIGFCEGGVRETIVHGTTGMLVQEEEEFAIHLEVLLASPERIKEMGVMARMRVSSHYGVQQAGAALESELLKLAEKGRV
jgi:glycosyltransferase involved in cell wall biosynthesis